MINRVVRGYQIRIRLRDNCLQLIHELKEGLDLATEIRLGFVRYAAAALRGVDPNAGVATDLLRLLRTFDATVETALQVRCFYLKLTFIL